MRRMVLLVLVWGCGAEESDAPAGRCPGVVDDGIDDPSEPGLYDDPAELGCDGAIDSIDACGIWHLDLDFDDFGSAPGAIRIDLSAEDDLEGLLFGRETEDVRLTSSSLFMRHIEMDDVGNVAIRALAACEARSDGALTGRYVRCNQDEECEAATFTAHKVEPLDEEPAEGVTLISEWSGPADQPWTDEDVTFNVRHQDELAYVVRGADGLHVVDLADPAQPRDRGHLPALYPEVGEYYNDVKIADRDGARYALVASSVRGVVVLDVTDPDAPVEVLAFPDPPLEAKDPTVNVHTMFIEEDRLYFTVFGGIEIYDIADPAAPVLLGGYWLPDLEESGGFVHDLFVEDAVAYLNYWNRGMVVVDAADPAAPVQVGLFDDYERRTSHSSWVTEAGGQRVAIHGDEDFGAHLRVVDVDPDSATAFEAIGSYQTRPEVSVHNVMAVGETALVTHYQDGLRVLDLSNPSAPVERGHYQTWPGPDPGYGVRFYEGALGVDYDPARDLVLVADTHRGLLVMSLDR